MPDSNRDPQPLVDNQPITNQDGFPTQYFIRWCQERQNAIEGTVTPEQVAGLIEQYLTEFLAAHQLQEGTGINITPTGNLEDSPTISLEDTAVTPDTYGDATHVAQITVDQKGRVTNAVEVAISGGGGGGGGGPIDYSAGVPALADFTQYNMGTSVLVDNPGKSISLYPDIAAGYNHRLLGMPAPAAPYRLVVDLQMATNQGPDNSEWCCVGFMDSANPGKMSLFTKITANKWMSVYNFSSYTAYASNTKGEFTQYWPNPPLFGLSDDGAGNVSFELSMDGVNFLPIITVAKASGYLGSSGYDTLVWGCNFNSAAGYAGLVQLLLWDLRT